MTGQPAFPVSVRAGRTWAEVYVRIPRMPRTLQLSWSRDHGWFGCVIRERFWPAP